MNHSVDMALLAGGALTAGALFFVAPFELGVATVALLVLLRVVGRLRTAAVVVTAAMLGGGALRAGCAVARHEVARADRILTLPVNPAFASLNLAQAVVIVGYEWFKQSGGELPFAATERSPPVAKQQLDAFYSDLERELDKVEFFRPAEKRGVMAVNLRNIFQRMVPSQQDIRTLHGVVTALVSGRKGPARGGVLDNVGAERLRELLTEHEKARAPSERTPLRGLPRLLRRNPTDAERALWQALVNDRRFAGCGFKRHVPVGPYITDFVSFQLRCVIELASETDPESMAKVRADKHAWLAAHDYRVVEVKAADVVRDVAKVLDSLASSAL